MDGHSSRLRKRKLLSDLDLPSHLRCAHTHSEKHCRNSEENRASLPVGTSPRPSFCRWPSSSELTGLSPRLQSFLCLSLHSLFNQQHFIRPQFPLIRRQCLLLQRGPGQAAILARVYWDSRSNAPGTRKVKVTIRRNGPDPKASCGAPPPHRGRKNCPRCT